MDEIIIATPKLAAIKDFLNFRTICAIEDHRGLRTRTAGNPCRISIRLKEGHIENWMKASQIVR